MSNRWAVKAGSIFVTQPSRSEAYKTRRNLKALGYAKPTVVDLTKVAR